MTDLEKAWKIAESKVLWGGNIGDLRSSIAEAIADGISLGRLEGVTATRQVYENLLLDSTVSPELRTRIIEAGRTVGSDFN